MMNIFNYRSVNLLASIPRLFLKIVTVIINKKEIHCFFWMNRNIRHLTSL